MYVYIPQKTAYSTLDLQKQSRIQSFPFVMFCKLDNHNYIDTIVHYSFLMHKKFTYNS
jgi:hypothetical protein